MSRSSCGKIIIDNSPVDINTIDNKEEFIASLLTLDVELSEDMNVSDVIHFFYETRGLIKSVLSDEYEAVRAIVTSCNLPRNYKSLRIYKSFRIEFEDNEEFIYLIPEIELVPSDSGEDGIRNIGGLPVFIDENIKLTHENLENNSKITIKSKTKINLFSIMKCVFDELPSLIKEGLILSK